jgi:hypothetical protein
MGIYFAEGTKVPEIYSAEGTKALENYFGGDCILFGRWLVTFGDLVRDVSGVGLCALPSNFFTFSWTGLSDFPSNFLTFSFTGLLA